MFLEPDTVEKAITFMEPLLVGATGGVVGLILKNYRPPRLYEYYAAVVVSSFAGYLVHNLCLAFELSNYLATVAVGVGGLCGPVTLHALSKYVFKTLRLEPPPDAPDVCPRGCNPAAPPTQSEAKKEDELTK